MPNFTKFINSKSGKFYLIIQLDSPAKGRASCLGGNDKINKNERKKHIYYYFTDCCTRVNVM